MFNKTLVSHHHHKSGPSHVTIQENRAPTDESVRILDEMQKAAEERILETVRLENNGFNCVVHFEHNAVDAEDIAKVNFMLNGSRFTIAVPLPEGTPQERMTVVRDKLAQEIAGQILSRSITAAQIFALRGPK